MALGKNISPGQGETYYRKDDYYLEREGGDDHKLEWGGKLAPEMGLSGKADASDWKNALNGYFPGGIEIKGGSFKDPDTGELLKRAGTDFVIEAPKTVSMLYAATDNQELKDWIMKTQGEVEKLSFDYLESQIGARRGHDGKEWETTGKALYGHVRHMSNREGECFIHAHGVFLNVTQNSDGKYQAMTNDRMMQYQRLVKEMGDAHWARRLSEKGIEIGKGKYGEVQIAAFSREQIEFSSSRGQNIEEYIKEKWGVEWSKLPREERNEKRWMREEAWERTRKAKKVHELDGLETRWKEEAKIAGIDEVVRKLEQIFEKGIKPKYLSPEKRLEIARDSLKFAVDHHTERESAVKEGELIRTALQAGRGKIGVEDLKKALGEAEALGEIVRQKEALAGAKQNLMTSREALEREKRILRMEKAGRGAVEPCLSPFQAEASLKAVQEKEGISLNAGQKAAASLILTTGNRFVGINGFAGVGKTTMLKPAVETLKEAGYRVIGLGPQHSAVHALRDAGIIEGKTLQAWLADRKAGEDLSQKTVVVIDEAGLTNARDLESAMRRIEKAGARAVLVGDIRQYESVAAGPVFRQLQENGMETVYVTEMQRQNRAAENVREAAKASVNDPAKALELLEKNITEIRDPEERYQALAEAYLKSMDHADTLVLTGTHEARRAVNAHVRKAWGLVGRGTEYAVFRAEDRTTAELRKIGTYEPGQEIRFGKSYRSLGIEAGEVVTVREVDREKGRIRLETPDGQIRDFEPNRLSGKGWEVGKTEKIELTGLSHQGGGDRIRITGNSLKEQGITNGMRGDVLEAGPDRLKILFDNGREASIPVGKTPLEIDHGYAQTGHSAQGLGAKTVILDLPSGSRTLNQRSFYTNLTRTKGEVIAFTDDREALFGAVTRENDKTMALDVEKAEGRQQTLKPEEKGMEQEIRRETLTREERKRLEEWKEGMKLTFHRERQDLGIQAGESVRVEKIHRLSGVVVLRNGDGRKITLEPQWMKRAREERAMKEIEALSQKAQGEEKRLLEEKISEIRGERERAREEQREKTPEREMSPEREGRTGKTALEAERTREEAQKTEKSAQTPTEEKDRNRERGIDPGGLREDPRSRDKEKAQEKEQVKEPHQRHRGMEMGM